MATVCEHLPKVLIREHLRKVLTKVVENIISFIMNKQKNIKSKIESLLFAAATPVSIKKLADVLGVSGNETRVACEELADELEGSGRGVRIIKKEQKYQLVTAPENSEATQKFLQDETSGELTPPSLETLTIIAYRGPVSKLEIERIRGVNCSLILRNLLIRGLIESGNDKTKKETYYTVSFDFLRFLGVNKVEDLPDYEKLSRHESIEEMIEDRS
jgi:segregation and condensation protein B